MEESEEGQGPGRESKKPSAWVRIKAFARHLGLFIALILYTGAGALIFERLEKEPELQRKADSLEEFESARKVFTDTLLNSEGTGGFSLKLEEALKEYEKAVRDVTEAGVDVETKEVTTTWNFMESAFFASTLLTTIGYGNQAPETFHGRLFCILFAFIGIPLTLSVIADLGKGMAFAVSSTWKKFRKLSPNKIVSGQSKIRKIIGKSATVITAVGSLLLYIAIGGYLFTLFEPWSFFDSFYFCFITMTTIGLGDLVPEKTEYMLLCTIYILIGLALTSTAIELVRLQYADSWKKMQERLASLHGMGITLRRHGDIDFDELKKLTKALDVRRMTLKDGSSWKKFWEHEKDSELAGNKKEPKLIQLIYFESNV